MLQPVTKADLSRHLETVRAQHAQGDDLSAVVTYDRRMTDAAGLLGLTVTAPR
jgi:hypothetical protein